MHPVKDNGKLMSFSSSWNLKRKCMCDLRNEREDKSAIRLLVCLHDNEQSRAFMETNE